MSVIATWNQGTPLAGKQYAVAGTIANRGAGLAAAIAVEVGLDPTKVNVSGTDVLVGGVARMTIADGEIDLPLNRRLGVKVLWLISKFGGDPQTTALQVLRAIVRVMKVRRGMTKVQVQALVGQLYDAIVADAN